MDHVRVDKWLWAARFFKSRSLAAAACDGGKVDVNRISAKPAKLIRAGDVLRVTLRGGKKIIKVLALAERRGSSTKTSPRRRLPNQFRRLRRSIAPGGLVARPSGSAACWTVWAAGRDPLKFLGAGARFC